MNKQRLEAFTDGVYAIVSTPGRPLAARIDSFVDRHYI
jgi:hypothetical protein